jgi:hypothetical protein
MGRFRNCGMRRRVLKQIEEEKWLSSTGIILLSG